MSALREIVARFRVDVDGSKLEKLDGAIGGSVGMLRNFAGVLAGSAVVLGVKNFIQGQIAFGDQLGDTSAQLGISAQALQFWTFAMGEAGLEAGAIQPIMIALARSANAAAGGSAEAQQSYRKLGVSVRGADGSLKNTDVLLREVVGAMGRIPSETERAGIAMKLLGRQGSRLLPLFGEGAAGLAAMEREIQALGGYVGDDFLKATDKADKAQRHFDWSLGILKARVATDVIPVVVRLMEVMTKMAAEGTRVYGMLQQLEKNTHVFTAALVLAAAAVAPFVASLVILAAPIIALVLLVEDLVVMFQGGESVIGKFIDSILGIGASQAIVETLTDAWVSLVETIKVAGSAVKSFFGGGHEEQKPDDIRGRVHAAAVARGEVTRTRGSGETWQQARIRYGVERGTAIISGRARATDADAAHGIATTPADFAAPTRRDAQRQRSFTRETRAERRERLRAMARQRSMQTTSLGEAHLDPSTTPNARRDDRQAERVRVASIPTSTATTRTVQIGNTQVNIAIPAGTDRHQAESLRRAVGEVIDQRNRQAAAALGQEAEADEA